MEKVTVLNVKGEKVNDITLCEEVFGIVPNDTTLYDAIRLARNSRRQGTAETKTRSEVSGGGRKPWRQKGTGRARAGSTRSPLWRHGGVVFGPTGNQNYTLAQNKKEHALAVKSALTLKAQEKDIIVVDSFKLDGANTKAMVAILKAINAKAKSLIVVEDDADDLVLSARNIAGVTIVTTNNVCVYDLLNNGSVIFTKASIKKVEEDLK